MLYNDTIAKDFCEGIELARELDNFLGIDQKELLTIMNEAFCLFAEKHPCQTGKAFSVYGSLVILLNAINRCKDVIEKRAIEFSEVTEENMNTHIMASLLKYKKN